MNKRIEIDLVDPYINDYVKSTSHELITLDVEEIENIINIRHDGKYCEIVDKYLITVTKI